MSSTLATSNNCNCSASNLHGTSAVFQQEGVVSSLENLRRLPNISQVLTNALAAYEDQAKSTLLGKQRRSGNYNTTDIAQNPPEILWPNEGYHSSTGKKGVPYDELSMAQWVTGQLNNVYSMKDPITAKHALLQVILAVRDATSLPWGQSEVCGRPPCMTWRRATSIGMMLHSGLSTISVLHRCQWPILN